jgi:hypothetical protein
MTPLNTAIVAIAFLLTNGSRADQGPPNVEARSETSKAQYSTWMFEEVIPHNGGLQVVTTQGNGEFRSYPRRTLDGIAKAFEVPLDRLEGKSFVSNMPLYWALDRLRIQGELDWKYGDPGKEKIYQALVQDLARFVCPTDSLYDVADQEAINKAIRKLGKSLAKKLNRDVSKLSRETVTVESSYEDSALTIANKKQNMYLSFYKGEVSCGIVPK